MGNRITTDHLISTLLPILFLIVAVAAILFILPISETNATDGDHGQCGPSASYVLEDGVLTITGSGSINESAFSAYMDTNEIESVIIGEGITSVGNTAFRALKGLNSVSISSTVVFIGNSAFANCSNLVSLVIPDNVVEIGQECFAGCTKLYAVTFGTNLSYVGDYVFSGMPKGVLYNRSFINFTPEAHCFDYMVGYNKEVVYGEVHSYNDSDFDYTYNTLSSSARIDSYKGSLNALSIPSSVNINDVPYEIIGIGGSGAICADSDQITSVDIPGTVRMIGNSAFYGFSIKNINLQNVVYIGNYAFFDNGAIEELFLPKTISGIGECAFFSCDSLIRVNTFRMMTLKDSVFAEPYGSGCMIKGDLKPCIYEPKNDVWAMCDLVIVDDTRYVMQCDWTRCVFTQDASDATCISSITMTIIEKNVTISTISLSDWYTNEVVLLPDHLIINGDEYTVKTLGRNICSDMVCIKIPYTVVNVASDTFTSAIILEDIFVSEENENYCSENGILFNKSKTELVRYPIGRIDSSYVIPDYIITTSGSAFSNCTLLTSVIIPENVKFLGKHSFYHCTSLTSITISDRTSTANEGCFELGTQSKAVTCKVYGCIPGKLDGCKNEYTYFIYDSTDYIVRYVVNGGSISLESETVHGEYVLKSYTGTKDGYTFGGWSDGISIYNGGDTVIIAHDTSFAAVWNKTTEPSTSDQGINSTVMLIGGIVAGLVVGAAMMFFIIRKK